MLLRDLGDGIILRSATPADAPALSALNAEVHRGPDATEPDAEVAAWTRDLLERPHPTVHPEDFVVAEDTQTGAIVSTVCLISQTWAYDGIAFGVGRPELVGTHHDYRGRGLVRAQFDILHRWSAERGHAVQAITGIPYYYRQFGYEMALDLAGGRGGFRTQIPQLTAETLELYHVRSATVDDIDFLTSVYDQAMKRAPLTCVRDDAQWRYTLEQPGPENTMNPQVCIVEIRNGDAIGFLAHDRRLSGNKITATAYELLPGVSWPAVTPAILRYLRASGDEFAKRDDTPLPQEYHFRLGVEHPVYRAVADLLPIQRPAYAWYIRVGDLEGFLRHIAPALERRLADSPLAGHTGEITLNFYRSGLLLAFAQGCLEVVEPWKPRYTEDGDASFPPLVFLQLLFGYRSIDELQHAFADCWTKNDVTRALLDTLFPRRPSNVWPIS